MIKTINKILTSYVLLIRHRKLQPFEIEFYSSCFCLIVHKNKDDLSLNLILLAKIEYRGRKLYPLFGFQTEGILRVKLASYFDLIPSACPFNNCNKEYLFLYYSIWVFTIMCHLLLSS